MTGLFPRPTSSAMAFKRTLSRASLAFILLLAALWGGLYYWAHYTIDGKIDGCLDAGGRWDYEQGKCEGQRSAP